MYGARGAPPPERRRRPPGAWPRPWHDAHALMHTHADAPNNAANTPPALMPPHTPYTSIPKLNRNATQYRSHISVAIS